MSAITITYLNTHKKHFPATQNACHERGREHNQRNLYAYPTQTEQRFIVMFVCNGNKNDQTKKTCSRIGRNSCQSFLTLIGGDSMCRIQPSRLRDRLNKKSTYQRTGHVRGGNMNMGGSTLLPLLKPNWPPQNRYVSHSIWFFTNVLCCLETFNRSFTSVHKQV